MPKSKSRGNGQGSAYKRGKTWTAQVIVGYRISENTPYPIPVKRTKAGFPTKSAALAACPSLFSASGQKVRMTMKDVYAKWEPFYSPRVTVSTMANYRAAFRHFSTLHDTYIDLITAADLQECMDNCKAGKRTHQMMKVFARLLWGYACDAEIVSRDVTEHLYIGKGETVQREPLTDEEVETVRLAIGKEPYAEYIYALCYLGFRPGEFLALKKEDFHTENGISYLVGGSKTAAGKNRRVPIPKFIDEIIASRLAVPGTEYLFPLTVTTRTGEFVGYKPMSHEYFRKFVFKPLMKKLGIAEGKTPYCTRHTYSDKLKNASGDDKTKAAIFGHTDYNFTKRRYQSTNLEDIKTVVDSIS